MGKEVRLDGSDLPETCYLCERKVCFSSVWVYCFFVEDLQYSTNSIDLWICILYEYYIYIYIILGVAPSQ